VRVVALGTDDSHAADVRRRANEVVFATPVVFGPNDTAYLTVATVNTQNGTGSTQVSSLSSAGASLVATIDGIANRPVAVGPDGKLYVAVNKSTGGQPPTGFSSQLHIIDPSVV
jgi:hypothetical protein